MSSDGGHSLDDYLDKGISSAFMPLPGSEASSAVAGGLVVPRAPKEYFPPERVGRYPVTGVIGRGGMGVVLRGRDPDLGRDLAIKVIYEEHAKDPELLERFLETQFGDIGRQFGLRHRPLPSGGGV